MEAQEPISTSEETTPYITDPIIQDWIDQLLRSREVREILTHYRYKRLDVTLHSSQGRAVLGPEISIR